MSSRIGRTALRTSVVTNPRAAAPVSPPMAPRRVGGPSVRPRHALLLAGGPRNGVVQNALVVLGGASIAVSAVIHLHLWMTGYSAVHIIGPLFVVQSVAGLAVAAAVVGARRLWAAAVGLGYLLSTIGGFLLSVNVGLFGFHDTWLAPFALAAFWDEAIGAALLLTGVVWCVLVLRDGRPGRVPG